MKGVLLGRREAVALVAATVAMVAALGVAFGPAKAQPGRIGWSPRAPGEVRPLLLARWTPAVVDATFDCRAIRGMGQPEDGTPSRVFATMVAPQGAEGLELALADDRIQATLGPNTVLSVPTAQAAPDDRCQVRLRVDHRHWVLRTDQRVVGEASASQPVVAGLVAGEDEALFTGDPLEVTVVSRVATSSMSGRQLLLLLLAVVAAGVALVALADINPRRWSAHRGRPRVGAPKAHREWFTIDLVVVGTTVLWAVIAPVLFDDGWVLSTIENHRVSGSFSSYFGAWGSQLPLGFVHDSLLATFAHVSGALLWLRVPAIIAGLGVWALCRRAMRIACPTVPGAASRVALAAMFLVFWIAWLCTLRPEPLVALLAAAVLVSMMEYRKRPNVRCITVALLAATVSISIHPAGLVAVAPILVSSPAIWTSLRASSRSVVSRTGAAVLVAIAIGLLLVFADSDVHLWNESRRIFGLAEHNFGWRDELDRYRLILTDSVYGTVVRRASMLGPLLVIGLFFARRRSDKNPVGDLPAFSLLWALVLLAFTPSKWPWQLGVIIAFAAVAIAYEVDRIAGERLDSARLRRSALALSMSLVIAMIAWRGSQSWGVGGFVDLAYGRHGHGLVGFDISSPALWIGLALLGGAVALVVAYRSRRDGKARAAAPPRALVSVGTWAPAVVFGVIALATAAMFVADGIVKAPGWSPAKQNLGMSGPCGFAGDLAVGNAADGVLLDAGSDAPSTADQVLPLLASAAPRIDGTISDLPVAPPRPLGMVIGTDDPSVGTVISPWYAPDPALADPDRGLELAFAILGDPSAEGVGLYVQFGRSSGTDVEDLGVVEIQTPNSQDAWLIVALSTVARFPADADLIRIVAVDTSTVQGQSIAVSTPWQLQLQPLDRLLADPDTVPLLGPTLKPDFPCARTPTLRRGIAEAPTLLLWEFGSPFGGAQSPWAQTSTIGGLESLLVKSRITGISVPYVNVVLVHVPSRSGIRRE